MITNQLISGGLESIPDSSVISVYKCKSGTFAKILGSDGDFPISEREYLRLSRIDSNMEISQVIPCTTECYNVFRADDGSLEFQCVYYIALCKDNVIRSCSWTCDGISIAEESSNFIGFYQRNQLPLMDIEFDETKVWGFTPVK